MSVRSAVLIFMWLTDLLVLGPIARLYIDFGLLSEVFRAPEFHFRPLEECLLLYDYSDWFGHRRMQSLLCALQGDVLDPLKFTAYLSVSYRLRSYAHIIEPTSPDSKRSEQTFLRTPGRTLRINVAADPCLHAYSASRLLAIAAELPLSTFFAR
jgi:hypothetical protein